ncbi:hypothetical protein NBRC10513v2_002742 [Rhodotorula toruloides]|uniref:BY PROTMAP: gi/472585914/gb/EMS23456.1/ TRAF-like zinc finger [Rhodosporidium toruloides NP11] gi/647395688/emb/CDR37311.1/ RHTO0S02e13300g1_1 [Rhodosporidium toruloides] n=1 Tax=Rhodotorula toruloides TaxID=5286 RepID=A0A0K3CCR7_RHOTO|nr:hypothetical protein AAT19DRAFT_13888 [Rhodotorula toruloides]
MGVDLERFVKDVPEYLHCPVCLEAACPPILVCWAEHALCETCADRLVKAQSLFCPTCRQGMVFPLRPSLLMKRAVEDYKIQCTNDGCPWTGSVANDQQHSSGCQHRKVPCKACKTLYKVSQRDAHLQVCPEKMIECPQGGKDCGGLRSGGMRRRRLMQQHLNTECAQWQCSAVPGCRTKTTLANLDEHEQGCRAAYDEILQLKLTIEENAKLANHRATEKALDLTASSDEEEKVFPSSSDTEDLLPQGEGPGASTSKAGELAQGPKRSARIASKRKAPGDEDSEPSPLSSPPRMRLKRRMPRPVTRSDSSPRRSPEL